LSNPAATAVLEAVALALGGRAGARLLDTPGHADFSEDTHRVLEAVDCAIMLLESAKGLEPQTLKLFDVCRSRHVPVVAFVNKWDRPGREPLELLDEIEQRIGLRPTPVNWPVGGGLPWPDRPDYRRIHRLHPHSRRCRPGARDAPSQLPAMPM
jgi:translation elongation factor EF-G